MSRRQESQKGDFSKVPFEMSLFLSFGNHFQYHSCKKSLPTLKFFFKPSDCKGVSSEHSGGPGLQLFTWPVQWHYAPCWLICLLFHPLWRNIAAVLRTAQELPLQGQRGGYAKKYLLWFNKSITRMFFKGKRKKKKYPIRMNIFSRTERKKSEYYFRWAAFLLLFVY